MAIAEQAPSRTSREQEWKDLLAEILPPQGEWSEEEYLILTEHRSRIIEYTDGVLEVLSMPTEQHQMLLGLLYIAFFSFFQARGGQVLFAPLRLRIRAGKFREPDLLLLLSADDSRRHNRFWDGADLTLEIVSQDKPERDLVDKVSEYAEARVPEYWIVDPQTETITVRRLAADTYETARIYKRGDRAMSALRPEFSVGVGELFDSARPR